VRVARVVAVTLVACLLSLVSFTSPASALTQNEKLVHAVYDDFLLREPTQAELAWWAAYVGGYGRSAFLNLLFDDDEFLELWLVGVRYYYLGTVDLGGTFATDLTALQTTDDFVESEVSVLAGSAYFANSGSTNTGFVQALYQSVLFRAADTGGLTYWVGRLNTGTSTRTTVARHFIRTTEAANKRVGGVSGPTTCPATTLTEIGDLSVGSYCIVLDRMASSGDVTYWGAFLGGTGQLPSLWTQLAASTEYFNNAQTRY
jgi:hypothetical protein